MKKELLPAEHEENAMIHLEVVPSNKKTYGVRPISDPLGLRFPLVIMFKLKVAQQEKTENVFLGMLS